MDATSRSKAVCAGTEISNNSECGGASMCCVSTDRFDRMMQLPILGFFSIILSQVLHHGLYDTSPLHSNTLFFLQAIVLRWVVNAPSISFRNERMIVTCI